MGFNFAGLIIKNNIENQEQLESLLNQKLEYYKSVSFDDATSSLRDDDSVDILKTKNGVLVIMALGQKYDLTKIPGEVIQFMNSDVSDTYYFEKCTDGKLDRKYITSQDNTAEDFGENYIVEDEDLIDVVWAFADEYLRINILKNQSRISFERFIIK